MFYPRSDLGKFDGYRFCTPPYIGQHQNYQKCCTFDKMLILESYKAEYLFRSC